MASIDTVVVDIDGTLVDSSYHHILAWARAFRHTGVRVDTWEIHRHMGMGGDRLVGAVAGDEVEEQKGDEIRDVWAKSFDELLAEVHSFEAAPQLLEAFERHGLKVVLATSGLPSHTKRALEILGIDSDDYALTTSEDASETKPSPELIDAAIEEVSGGHAVVVGDTVWDVEAAKQRRLSTIALLTGGFSEADLRDAGAALVFESPRELLGGLDGALRQLAT